MQIIRVEAEDQDAQDFLPLKLTQPEAIVDHPLHIWIAREPPVLLDNQFGHPGLEVRLPVHAHDEVERVLVPELLRDEILRLGIGVEALDELRHLLFSGPRVEDTNDPESFLRDVVGPVAADAEDEMVLPAPTELDGDRRVLNGGAKACEEGDRDVVEGDDVRHPVLRSDVT